MTNLTREELLQELNEYLKNKHEEQQLKILMVNDDIEEIRLTDLSIHVVLGIYHATDDVFVMEHTFEIVQTDRSIIQTMYSYYNEDIEEGEFVPENEGEIDFYSRNGNKYPCLVKRIDRGRTVEEELIVSVLDILEYVDFFQFKKEFYAEMLMNFKSEKTKELNESALQFFPFVNSFEYDGGSYIKMNCINGTSFSIRCHEFQHQLEQVKIQTNEKVEKTVH